MTLTAEVIAETKAALPETLKDVWTLGDLVRIGSVAVDQDFGGFGSGREACAQSAAGLGYRALFR